MTTITELIAVADALGDATCLPDHIKSRGDAVAIILAGHDLGLGPMASIRGIHLVQGKIGLNADVMAGLMLGRGYRLDWLESSATCARLSVSHTDGRAPYTEVYDVDRAKKAGLWGRGQWSKYPEAMLRARCLSAAGRAYAADALHGCYSLDEAREIAGGAPEPVSDAPPVVAHMSTSEMIAEQARDDAEISAYEARSRAKNLLLELGGDAKECDDDESRAALRSRLAHVVDVYRHPMLADETAAAWARKVVARIGELLDVDSSTWLDDGTADMLAERMKREFGGEKATVDEDEIPW